LSMFSQSLESIINIKYTSFGAANIRQISENRNPPPKTSQIYRN
jgi:hypothetical protein